MEKLSGSNNRKRRRAGLRNAAAQDAELKALTGPDDPEDTLEAPELLHGTVISDSPNAAFATYWRHNNATDLLSQTGAEKQAVAYNNKQQLHG